MLPSIRRKYMRVWPGVLLGIISIYDARACTDVSVQVVANAGDQAPGFPIGATFWTIGYEHFAGSLNERNSLAFTGRVHGGGVTQANDTGAWLWAQGQLTLMIREGDPAPSLPAGVLLGTVSRIAAIGNNDDVYVLTLLTGSGVSTSNDQSLWRCSRAEPTPRLVFREGDAAPGLPDGVVFNSLWFSVPYANDEIVIAAYTSAGSGAWRSTSHGLELILATGVPAPGFEPWVTIERVYGIDCLDRTEVIGVGGALTGDGITPENDYASWIHTSGETRLFARESDPAIGLPPDIVYDLPLIPSIGIGRGEFRANVRGPGVDPSLDTACYRLIGDQPALVVRDGDHAAGFGPDVTLSVFYVPIPTEQSLVYRAVLSGPEISSDNEDSLWVDSNGVTELKLQEGQQAPELPDGILIDSLRIEYYYPDLYPLVNRFGRILLPVILRGDDVTTANRVCLLYTDPLGVWRRVVRSTDAWPRRPGTVSSVSSIGAIDLNNRGTLALYLRFGTSGSAGLFLVEVGCPVPGCARVDIAENNCRINLADLAMVLSEFGDVSMHSAADTDFDGDVDLQDLGRVLAAYGNDCYPE